MKLTIIDELSPVKPTKMFGMDSTYIAPLGLASIVTVDLIWMELEKETPLTSRIYNILGQNGDEPLYISSDEFTQYIHEQLENNNNGYAAYFEWSATVLMLELCVQGEEL